MLRSIRAVGAALLTAAVLSSGLALAQEPAVARPAVNGAEGGVVGAEQDAQATLVAELEAKKQAVESDASVDEAVRTQAAQFYAQAIAASQELVRVRTETARLRERVDGAPDRIGALRAPVAPRAVETPGAVAALATTETLRQELRDSESALESAKRTLATYENAFSALQKSGSTLGADVADRDARVKKLQSELEAAAPPGTSMRMAEARASALTARKALREAEIELFQRQLRNHDLLTELATLEREAAAAAAAEAQAVFDRISGLVQSRREAEAATARSLAEEAQQTAASLPAPVVALAAQNLALSTELQDVTRRGAGIAESLKATQARSTEISGEFASTRQRVEVVGSTAAIGRMLRRRHADLPSVQGFRRTADIRRRAINLATDRQIDLDEQRRALRDVEAGADALFTSLAADNLAGQNVTREQILDLLAAQRNAVVELQKAYGRYLTDLTALDVAERQLVLAANDFLEFIDERLLWIQSISQMSVSDISAASVAIAWFWTPASWSKVLGDLVNAARERALRTLLAVVVVLGAFLVRRAARIELRALSDETRRIRTDRFAHTVKALVYTAAAAGAWPLLLVVVARLLSVTATADAFTISVAAGLRMVATFLFSLDFLRRLCRPYGLGDRHFRWPEPMRKDLAAGLRRFILLGIPLVFLVAMTAEYAQPQTLRGLGRPAFVALMLALVLLLRRVFAKSSAFVAQFDRDDRPNRIAQLRFLWFPVIIAMPLVIALLSVVGYHYSALELENQIRDTAWLAIALLVVRESILRMLYLAERRLRFENILRRREEARAHRERESGPEPAGATAVAAAAEEPDVDYSDLGEQARRLVNITLLFAVIGGLWAVWSELLPALSILDTVTLPMVTHQYVDGVEREVAVTLGDLGVALLIAVAAVFAAKNLTGLLEIAILQRLPLDPGGRYAIVTLAQYAIIAGGFIAAIARIGVEWSSIQWLVAALSVGLGFGLQEIVANFVSGIILLLERPIRVGDLVTVGDVSGTVSRIQIRATTIVNFDKQELLVPNKEFITGRVLNWTLTDQLNRVVISVGVAYGSDVDRALELLAEVAAEHPQVLDDPVPTMIFERFGDSSLQLALRCFLATLEFRVATMTELHSAINRKFNEAGIVIAFPQRDIHVDVTRPIEIRMQV